jgi:hypothetical protein
MIQIET